MNKKGLTFMQFAIALICLCVVLILVWPLVNKIIDNSEVNVFSTKVKEMITSVGKTYVMDQNRRYSNVVTGAARLNNVEGMYQYIIDLNDTGNVISFKITNGKFKVEGKNSDGVEVNGIGSTYEIEHATTKYTLNESGEFIEQ